MTAKDKAKELIQLFYNKQCSHSITKLAYKSAKQCALICVDEKQKTIDKMFNSYYTMPEDWQKEYDKLEEVKQEIKKY